MKQQSSLVRLAAACLGLLLLCGCGDSPAAEAAPARAVYFLTETESGRELGYEVVEFSEEEETEQQIREVIEAMRHPLNINDHSVLAEDMELREVEVFGSTVVVRFSEAYDRLTPVEISLLHAAVTLSLSEIEGVRYVRVTGGSRTEANFMSSGSVLLDDDDLRLTVFEVEVWPYDRETGQLFSQQLRILTEKDTLTPQLILDAFLSGQLGDNMPFDGRMDVRSAVGPGAGGMVRVELYVPVEMDLRGREAELYSLVNSLFACRSVESVSVLIGGREPSERGLVGCDGPLVFNADYIENGDTDH